MTAKNEILMELKEISPVVAELGAITPYEVPAGYFEDFAGHVMARLHDTDEPVLSFEKSGLNNPFTTPDNYFEAFSEVVLNRVKAEEAPSHTEELKYLSPILGQLDKAVPFSLPVGYFEQFPEDVVAGVYAIDFVNQKLNPRESTILPAAITNVYEVPDRYFENLPQQVLQKVNSSTKGPLISMIFGRKIVRYAVVACFAALVSVSAWLFFRDGSTVNTAADISGIENMSNDEISNYLETNSVVPDADNNVPSSDIREEDIMELLADVPDAELKNYLEQQAFTKDLDTN
jgi:hypothetical protein